VISFLKRGGSVAEGDFISSGKHLKKLAIVMATAAIIGALALYAVLKWLFGRRQPPQRKLTEGRIIVPSNIRVLRSKAL
jgi:hypothetical protein